MGSKDDLFGSGGRTVLRPRRDDGSAPDADSLRPAGISRDDPDAVFEQTVFSPGGAPTPGWSTGTIVDTTGAAARMDVRRAKGEIADDVLLDAFAGLSYASPNPLLSAAAPLLMLLGDLQVIAAERKLDALSRHVANAIREFERNAAESGVPGEDALIAKYVLCETADDLIGNLPGVERKAWLAEGMLGRHFDAAAAGTGFFDALNKALADPEAHYSLLELMHACISLGFEGQYRDRPNGREGLQRVRRDVYETLRFFKDRADGDISPNWQGLSATMAPKRKRVPLWAIAAIMPAIVAAAFFALRIVATDRGEEVASELLALNPTEPATIQHPEFAPSAEPRPVEPPPVMEEPRVAQVQRIRQALADDIAGGGLEVGERGNFIVVGVSNVLLFDSGKAELKPGFEAIAEHIAAALEPEPGPIRIVGHTDNVRPNRSSVFKSNFDLSVARARAVDEILKPKISDPSRIEVAGKGDEEPIADNATPEGRASNRRVEVMIKKEETL
jgi:type VI secretion system protein ImpK